MSTFRNALVFFDQLGVYDVVLPFLLIFTLVYAMLEKTKIFGQEEIGGQKVSRKNLNAMVAFCTAFLVVASSQLVMLINVTIAKTMVLLVAAILFMILVGTFSKDEELFLKGGWQKAFMFITFIGVALILLYNLGWLQYTWMYAVTNLNGPVVGSFALLIVVITFMVWITGEKKTESNSSGGK